MSAIIGLTHDLLMTVSALAILYFCGLPIRIDMHVIAALMTIIGYSLNDIIIVFDRIREDRHLYRKKRLPEVINNALNTTLSRTALTAGTTLLVLISLVLIAGPSIFTFALTMALGVSIGTISSLFVAAPALILLDKTESKVENTHHKKAIVER